MCYVSGYIITYYNSLNPYMLFWDIVAPILTIIPYESSWDSVRAHRHRRLRQRGGQGKLQGIATEVGIPRIRCEPGKHGAKTYGKPGSFVGGG